VRVSILDGAEPEASKPEINYASALLHFIRGRAQNSLVLSRHGVWCYGNNLDVFMKLFAAILFVLLPVSGGADGLPPIKTVFIILLENHNWSSIRGSADAPYINDTLLPMASYCAQYYNPPGLHPSEPNYLWLEAGTNFGVTNDNNPSSNHQNTTNHLVTLLENAGISWRTYQEDVSGTYVPLTATNKYYPKHNPFVFFDDVTGTNDPSYPYGIAHIRPYSELASDLANNTVARYNFITPNQCHDMHDSCAPVNNPVKQGDLWLSTNVPMILASAAYTNGGALFITWDEGVSGDGPIGMLVLSPLARGGGYFNNTHYTHSSTLRTFQEVFQVAPFLGDAVNATDLGDLFTPYGFSQTTELPNGYLQLTATGIIPDKTNVILASTNLTWWTPIATNVSATNTFTFTDTNTANFDDRFYRLLQLP
jgi:phosphatidylinositol-3-phosphatase